MNARENIRRVIAFNQPERIGFDFNPPHAKDILWIPAARYLVNDDGSMQWNQRPDLLARVPGFTGEVRLDAFGNVVGRLNQKTKGEIIRGRLQDDWDDLATYQMPVCDPAYWPELSQARKDHIDRYMLAVLPISPFSTARDLRKLEQFLADVLLEPEQVSQLLARIGMVAAGMIEAAAAAGADGVCIYDDWGTQQALLVSPAVWRALFKPVYQSMIEQAHRLGMAFFLHSCGYIREIMADLIEIGLDVFQLDQPELIGIDTLAGQFGGKVTFWCPVDIQKTMTSGDKTEIEQMARTMIGKLGGQGGGFIAKDYPSWEDIDIPEAWAGWARQVFLAEGWYGASQTGQGEMNT